MGGRALPAPQGPRGRSLLQAATQASGDSRFSQSELCFWGKNSRGPTETVARLRAVVSDTRDVSVVEKGMWTAGFRRLINLGARILPLDEIIGYFSPLSGT